MNSSLDRSVGEILCISSSAVESTQPSSSINEADWSGALIITSVDKQQ